jgi:hypothetical protein
MGLFDKLKSAGIIGKAGRFIGKYVKGAGKAIGRGVTNVGNAVFGEGGGVGKQLFKTASDFVVDQALNKASVYGKRFANSDFIRNNAQTMVPAFENAADYFTDKLRRGYNGAQENE